MAFKNEIPKERKVVISERGSSSKSQRFREKCLET